MKSRLFSLIVGLSILIGTSPATNSQDFSFSTPEGQAVPLSSFRGNVVVLLFSSVKDPQRREGLKALQDLAERQQGRNVKIFWVSINNETEMTNDQLRNISNTAKSVSVFRDSNQAVFKKLCGKVGQLPTIVVLDRQGSPFGEPRGGFNPNADFINDLSSMIDGGLRR